MRKKTGGFFAAICLLTAITVLLPGYRTEAASLAKTVASVYALSETKIQITVTAVAGANMYQYQLAEDSAFQTGLRSKKSSSSVKKFGNLSAGQTYFVRARGYLKPQSGKRRYGSWSDVVQIRTKPSSDMIYSSVLKKYRQAYEEGWSQEKLAQEELNRDAEPATLGYCYLDMNQDGDQELLIGQAKGTYGAKGEFLALYGLVDGKVTNLEWSEYRHQARLCTKNGTRYVNVFGSNGASNGVHASYYSFNGSKMVLEEEILYDFDLDRENPYFYTKTDNYLKTDLTPITEKQRDDITGRYAVLPVSYRSIALCRP